MRLSSSARFVEERRLRQVLQAPLAGAVLRVVEASGAKPAWAGSSESWTLSVPGRGASKNLRRIQVRQLQTTATSASAARPRAAVSVSGLA